MDARTRTTTTSIATKIVAANIATAMFLCSDRELGGMSTLSVGAGELGGMSTLSVGAGELGDMSMLSVGTGELGGVSTLSVGAGEVV